MARAHRDDARQTREQLDPERALPLPERFVLGKARHVARRADAEKCESQALHHELVDSGQFTDRRFHDAVIRANSLPVELVRALFSKEELKPDTRSHWRFAD